MAYPTNYRYTREHEWIVLDGAIGTIGITDYAQNSLGDIVYVDVPKVGDAVTANATFGSVESVKAVSDLYSPVTGTVTAINEELKSAPDKINEAPHETWIIKVELADPAQFDTLLDAAAYEAFVSEENRKLNQLLWLLAPSFSRNLEAVQSPTDLFETFSRQAGTRSACRMCF